MRYTNIVLYCKIDFDGEVFPSGGYPIRGRHFHVIIRSQRQHAFLRLLSDA